MTESIAAALAGGFALGLFGSLHCVGMCGGIVAALGQAGGKDTREGHVLALEAVPYHVGRISSYSLAGAAVGAVGASFALGMDARWLLRLAAGLLLMAAGAYVAGWWLGLSHLERWLTPLWQRISPLTSRLLPAETVGRRLALGALWGWLPCGLVYSALVLAAASGNAGTGALTMTAFGLGTAPSLLAVGAFGRALTGVAQRISVRRGAGLALCLFGLWTIFGPGLVPGGGHDAHGGGAGADHAVHEHHPEPAESAHPPDMHHEGEAAASAD